MKEFKSLEALINAKAAQALKAFIIDQPEAVGKTFTAIKAEILKEREYQKNKVKFFTSWECKQLGIEHNGVFGIKNFGYIRISK